MGRKKEEEKQEEARRGPSLLPLVAGLLGIATALQVLVFFLHAYQAVTFPYQLDYGEGPILQIARHVAHGGEMYPPVDEPPYLIGSYVPLYYALCALGVKFTGVNFLFGRLLSCVGALAIAVFAALVVWHHTRHRLAACLAGGMILAMPHFMVWAALMRVDVLALAFAMAGFYFFTVNRRFVGMPLFALATLTRRTTVGAMAAAFLDHARKSGAAQALRLLGFQVAVIVVLFGLALLLTRGGLYRQLYLHTATSVGEAWSWRQLWSLLWVPDHGSPLKLWPVYFAVTVVAAVWSACYQPARVLLLYFVITCAVFLTGGRVGSGYNYLLEPTAVGAMMFGFMWGVVSRKSGPGRIGLMLLAGAVAAQMLWTLTPPHFVESLGILRPRTNAAASRHVIERIRQADGPVLCEDTGLSLLADKEPPLMPFEFTMLARAGALDPEPVFREVRQGRYPLVVLRFNPLTPREQELHRSGADWKGGRWPEGIIAGVVARYRLDEEAGPYFLFVPK